MSMPELGQYFAQCNDVSHLCVFSRMNTLNSATFSGAHYPYLTERVGAQSFAFCFHINHLMDSKAIYQLCPLVSLTCQHGHHKAPCKSKALSLL